MASLIILGNIIYSHVKNVVNWETGHKLLLLFLIVSLVVIVFNSFNSYYFQLICLFGLASLFSSSTVADVVDFLTKTDV